MSVDVLLHRLEAVRQTGPGRWIARCPAHQDRRPSLAVRELNDGRVLVHDFAGCPTHDVLCAIGLTMSDLFPERVADYARPERRPFAAGDVLRALATELMICCFIADALGTRALTKEERDRLSVACGRLHAGLEVIDGR